MHTLAKATKVAFDEQTRTTSMWACAKQIDPGVKRVLGKYEGHYGAVSYFFRDGSRLNTFGRGNSYRVEVL